MGRIDDEPNPKWDEWAKKPLSKEQKERLLRAMEGGGGGGKSSTGFYQTAMYVGLIVFTVLGWRLAVELGRIRRAVAS